VRALGGSGGAELLVGCVVVVGGDGWAAAFIKEGKWECA